MCGIIGLYGKEDVVEKTIASLIAIQHRGQDSCGVYSLDGDKVNKKKCKGLVSENRYKAVDGAVTNSFSNLKGNVALGHVRYATIGDSSIENAQPFYSDSGVSLCHNGNVTNVKQLKEELRNAVPRRHVNSDCDADILLKVFVDELSKYDIGKITVGQIFDSIRKLMDRVDGSYSALAIINDIGFVAFRDPYGIKPIVFGKKDSEQIYGFSSESVAFDSVGLEIIDNLKPGEAIFIDKEMKVHRKSIKQQEHRPCVFEYIYFALPSSVIDNKSVYEARFQLGKLLGEEWNKISEKKGLKADVVCEVPTTAFTAAQGFSEVTGIPYASGIIRNNYIYRSFINPDQKSREKTVDLKLLLNKAAIEGKNVVVIDDSIVRGTTSKKIVRRLKDVGAKKVYLCSSAPPIICPCVYGIDMSVKQELIAAEKTIEEIRKFTGADELFYQSIENLRKALPEFNFCDACFSGKYPTNISIEQLKEIENERIKIRGMN